MPALVESSPGVPLRVTIKNEGAHTHTFTIDGLGVDVELRPGTTTVVTLHLPGPGEYRFSCRFHRSYGMSGRLVAEQ